MSYQVKVFGFAAVLVTVVAVGVLITWAYMEIQHQVERRQLMDCIRSETVADGTMPAQRVIDSNIRHCDGEDSWLIEAPDTRRGSPR